MRSSRPRFLPTPKHQHWWLHYDAYLQTATWAEKRRRVFERAQWLCEGCGGRRASHVHHLRYPEDVLPGSERWIRTEKLFDLVALCHRCHRDLHPDKNFNSMSARTPPAA